MLFRFGGVGLQDDVKWRLQAEDTGHADQRPNAVSQPHLSR